MVYEISLFRVTCIILCFTARIDGQRRGKFLAGEYTTTLNEKYFITSVVPSSCVQVEATVPVCRNLKHFKKFPTIGGYVVADPKEYNQSTGNEIYLKAQPKPLIVTTPLGWGQYFGFFARTVTQVNRIVETVVVQDPNVVVTFAIKGCKPADAPMDLDRCEPPPTVIVEEILPTSRVTTNVIKPTLYPLDTDPVPEADDNYYGPFVEATHEDVENLSSASIATEPL